MSQPVADQVCVRCEAPIAGGVDRAAAVLAKNGLQVDIRGHAISPGGRLYCRECRGSVWMCEQCGRPGAEGKPHICLQCCFEENRREQAAKAVHPIAEWDEAKLTRVVGFGRGAQRKAAEAELARRDEEKQREHRTALAALRERFPVGCALAWTDEHGQRHPGVLGSCSPGGNCLIEFADGRPPEYTRLLDLERKGYRLVAPDAPSAPAVAEPSERVRTMAQSITARLLAKRRQAVAELGERK